MKFRRRAAHAWGPLRPVPARFNDEAMTLQNWPAKDNHMVIAEFHY